MRRIGLALLLLVVGLEIFSRVWVATHPYPTYIDSLLTSPAYDNAPYWTDEFRAALRDDKWGSCINPLKYLNRDERDNRCVVNQAGNALRTIWIFGNSTLHSREVPDEYTIASQLQALLPDWRVENIVQAGSTLFILSDPDNIFFKQPFRAGDIVITYSGIIDATHEYIDLRRMPGDEPLEQACRITNSTLRDIFYAVRALCDWQLKYVPDSLLTDEVMGIFAAELETKYRDSKVILKRYVESKGARYINVLQPHLWTRSLTDAEKQIESTAPLIPPRAGVFVRFAYPYLQPYADVDLTHALDRVRDEQVVFYDGWHGSHLCNSIVARAIAAALR